MHIQVDGLSKYYGDVKAVKDISFSVEKGEITTLLGPSGCGKTTTLRSIGGLETPNEGSVSLGGEPLYDADKGINVPVKDRNMGMVFQSYAVWPHMTVFDNVAFPLNLRKEDNIDQRVQDTLELVGIPELGERYPEQLSGGQQQRVALARAIVYSPEVLLLDEPLSNLDAKLRKQMQFELLRLQDELDITFIYVTHNQEEALTLSDNIIVMNEGEITQKGDPQEIYLNPKTEFVGDFIGESNIVPARLIQENGTLQLEIDVLNTVAELQQEVPSNDVSKALIRPGDFQLTKDGERAQADGLMSSGQVKRSTFVGDKWVLDIDTGSEIITAYDYTRRRWEDGEKIELSVPTERISLLA
jgi:iron(III) transport system ATP-binding protein